MRKAILAIAALAMSVPVVSFVVPTTAALAFQGCGAGSYVNSRGHCVPRPRQADRPPAGATAQCRDGTYSFSENHRGTCSHHGGVQRWL
jgi:hypothetical protein